MIENLLGTHADWVVGIARIVLGIIFFGHGTQKMLGWYGGPGLASSMRTFTEHLHLPSTLAFLVIAGELFSGIGLIVGLAFLYRTLQGFNIRKTYVKFCLVLRDDKAVALLAVQKLNSSAGHGRFLCGYALKLRKSP